MKITKIKIGAQQYEISCQENEEEKIQNLGKIINQKMQDLLKNSTTHNINHSLMLVIICLSLQDEVFDLQDKISRISHVNLNHKDIDSLTDILRQDNSNIEQTENMLNGILKEIKKISEILDIKN